ncbi:tryptorubin family RiPP precursor [Streptomyces sp. NPDC048462]|uniref:tryptorubin family RiPP precursor n=1 Tax=Streptomyces sp. NPDC048462 TaxID=3365555 RepID=UPI003720C8FB
MIQSIISMNWPLHALAGACGRGYRKEILRFSSAYLVSAETERVAAFSGEKIIDNSNCSGLYSFRRSAVVRIPCRDRESVSQVRPRRVPESKFRATDGGAVMKFLFQLKEKMTPEKSLKAYAWYIWY